MHGAHTWALLASAEADCRGRLDCELPETAERFQDNISTWSDANGVNSSIEDRLLSLERGMGEMMHLMRQMINQPSNAGGSPNSPGMRSQSIDENMLPDQGPPITLQPVQFIQDLQVELFESDRFSPETDLLGDVVSRGIVDAKLSLKLLELYVSPFLLGREPPILMYCSFMEYFSPWVSIDHSHIQRNNSLLFNTACLLASQHLPGMPEKTIHDISLQVQHALTMTLWRKSPLTDDLLQALALLGLFPSSGHKDGLMDGWLLSGISINHALMSFRFLKLSSTKSFSHVSNEQILPQLRLWNVFCLTHLQYVSSYLSLILFHAHTISCALGYGRAVNVQQQHLDHCNRILDHPRATPDDRRIVAEIQLYRIALRLQNNTQRLRFAEAEFEEIERWKMDWAHLLSTSSPTSPTSFPNRTSKRRPINPRTRNLVLPAPPPQNRSAHPTRP